MPAEIVSRFFRSIMQPSSSPRATRFRRYRGTVLAQLIRLTRMVCQTAPSHGVHSCVPMALLASHGPNRQKCGTLLAPGAPFSTFSYNSPSDCDASDDHATSRVHPERRRRASLLTRNLCQCTRMLSEGRVRARVHSSSNHRRIISESGLFRGTHSPRPGKFFSTSPSHRRTVRRWKSHLPSALFTAWSSYQPVKRSR